MCLEYEFNKSNSTVAIDFQPISTSDSTELIRIDWGDGQQSTYKKNDCDKTTYPGYSGGSGFYRVEHTYNPFCNGTYYIFIDYVYSHPNKLTTISVGRDSNIKRIDILNCTYESTYHDYTVPSPKYAFLFQDIRFLKEINFVGTVIPGGSGGGMIIKNNMRLEIIRFKAIKKYFNNGNGEIVEGSPRLSSFDFQRNSALSKIDFGENEIRELGENMFSYCYKLKEICGLSGITKIGKETFMYCGNLSLPSNFWGDITCLPTSSFYGCGITSIDIPATVTSIEGSAFAGSKLKTINYGGTKQDFLKIKLADNSFYNTPELEQVICTDGSIQMK